MANNHDLEMLFRQAGFVQADGQIARKQAARAVRDEARQHGVERTITHTYVARWLHGIVPRDDALKRLIADAVGRRLGRTVGLDELGFQVRRPPEPDLGLEYPRTVAEGIENVASLWQVDLQNALEGLPVNDAAWSRAAMAWLIDDPPAWPIVQGSQASGGVGVADIERIDATAKLFDQLDSTYGGGQGRRPVVEFLRTDVTRMLRGRYSETTGQKLFAATARATLLAAWMSYDAGLHPIAQRYFVQALWLAAASGNHDLAGSVLDAMSHQATFIGTPREAIRLSRSAQRGLTGPFLTSHFLLMEARGLAKLGDKKSCEMTLSRAESEFERSQGRGPEWLSYFDHSELAAEFAHCYRDLGVPSKAIHFGNEAATGSIRSDFFVTMVLADSYADSGLLEQACSTAEQALLAGEQLHSHRSVAYVNEFRARIYRNRNTTIVRDFEEKARTQRLWTPS